MKDPTPYPEINAVLSEWTGGLERLLGNKIVGLYLSGSLAYGDFVPERSDIDLQAVVQSPLTEHELRSVEQLHKQIEGSCTEQSYRSKAGNKFEQTFDGVAHQKKAGCL